MPDYTAHRLAYDSATDNLLDAVTDTHSALDVFRRDLASEQVPCRTQVERCVQIAGSDRSARWHLTRELSPLVTA